MILNDAMRIARKVLARRFVSEEEHAYKRLALKGFRPGGIVDVGAYHGDWTRLARKVFPSTPILMIEAQAGKRPMLEATCAELTNVAYVCAVLAARAGEAVSFYEMETGSSMLPENSNIARTTRTLTSVTLDEVAAKTPDPLFLKIDVQGAELEVLAGGAQTLQRADVVQLEVAMLPYNDGAPTFLEVIRFMDDRGFVPLDYSGFTRPNGQDLVQVDIIFTKRSSALRPSFFQY